MEPSAALLGFDAIGARTDGRTMTRPLCPDAAASTLCELPKEAPVRTASPSGAGADLPVSQRRPARLARASKGAAS